MNPQLSLVSDGKKFMWDGLVYSSEAEASTAKGAYQQNNFEVRLLVEEEKYLVYTRRVIEQVPAAN